MEINKVEHHLLRTNEVSKETRELIYDIEPHLKESLIKQLNNLPTIEIKKNDLGVPDEEFKLGSNESIQIQPTIFTNIDSDRPELGWNVISNKQERQLPPIVAEAITNQDLKKYKDILPRTYRGVDEEREKAWIFRDENENPVGWVVVNENGKEAHVGFIGVSVNHEQTGYGSSILNFLQEKYDYLGLTMLAYDTAGRGYENARTRLARFYARNGFYEASGGMYWSNKLANLETKTGVQLVNDAVISQTNLATVNDILDIYVERLVTDNASLNVFSEKEKLMMNSWVALKKELKTLRGESIKYNNIVQEREHQRKMAEWGDTETVGI